MFTRVFFRARGRAFEPYTHLNIAGRRFRLWRQHRATFYNLGRYIAADVKPIDERWPVWIHKLRADWLSRHVARDTARRIAARMAPPTARQSHDPQELVARVRAARLAAQKTKGT